MIKQNTKPKSMAYTHFSTEQRNSLEDFEQLAHPPKVTDMALVFHKHRSSIYRELHKGDKDGEYNSSVAKKKTKEKRLKANSRFNKILSNDKLEIYILQYLKKHWSPDEISQ